MGHWTLEDIPWDRFDPSRVNVEVVSIVKAASMVEYNADDYRHYLNNIFKDDPRVCRAIDRWTLEEVQHGRALGRWAALADPDFDFEQRFALFTRNFKIPLDVEKSVRGSRSGEMVARCMVETGTNSFYSALADATDEPVLKDICRRIADDEYAHYCMFRRFLGRYLEIEALSRRERLKVAFDRMTESEDDELATAYWAANRDGEPYDRRANSVAYAHATLKYYRPRHTARAVEMVFRTIGLDPDGPFGWLIHRAARTFVWYRGRFIPRMNVLRARLSATLTRHELTEQRV